MLDKNYIFQLLKLIIQLFIFMTTINLELRFSEYNITTIGYTTKTIVYKWKMLQGETIFLYHNSRY